MGEITDALNAFTEALNAFSNAMANAATWVQNLSAAFAEFYANNLILFWVIVGMVGTLMLLGLISLIS